MRLEKREALIRDLRKLEAEIPELITCIEAGDEDKTKEALVLLTKGSSGRFQFLMDKLTDYIIAESAKGNDRPFQMAVSGEIWK